MDELIKIVAKYFIVLSVLLAAFVFLRIRTREQRWRFAVLVVAGGILSLLIAKLGNHFISDPRPFVVGHFAPLTPHAPDNGFPSDHTLLAAFVGWASLCYSRKLGLLGLAIAAAIGIARIAAGVHHLEDIVGSFVIAGLGTVIVYPFIRQLALPSRLQKASSPTASTPHKQ